MSNDKPLKRYAPSCPDQPLIDGGSLNLTMEEASGGHYIDEDELRQRLNVMLDQACDPGEKDALHAVLKLIDTPNW